MFDGFNFADPFVVFDVNDDADLDVRFSLELEPDSDVGFGPGCAS